MTLTEMGREKFIVFTREDGDSSEFPIKEDYDELTDFVADVFRGASFICQEIEVIEELNVKYCADSWIWNYSESRTSCRKCKFFLVNKETALINVIKNLRDRVEFLENKLVIAIDKKAAYLKGR